MMTTTIDLRQAMSRLRAARMPLLHAQEALGTAVAAFEVLQAVAEPADDAPDGAWAAYLAAVHRAADVVGLDVARQAVRTAERRMLDAVEAVAEAGGLPALDLADVRRARHHWQYRQRLLALGLQGACN